MRKFISGKSLAFVLVNLVLSCQTPAYSNSNEDQAQEVFQVRESREIEVKLGDGTFFVVTRTMGGLVRVEMRVRHSNEALSARIDQYMQGVVAQTFFELLGNEIQSDLERFKLWKYSFRKFKSPMTTAIFEAPDSTGHLELIMGIFRLFRSLLISPVVVSEQTESKLREKLELTLNPEEYLGKEKLESALEPVFPFKT